MTILIIQKPFKRLEQFTCSDHGAKTSHTHTHTQKREAIWIFVLNKPPPLDPTPPFSSLQNGSSEKREVRQFQFTAWPDHGVPEYPTPFLAFLRRVKTCNPPDAGPIIAHCRSVATSLLSVLVEMLFFVCSKIQCWIFMELGFMCPSGTVLCSPVDILIPLEKK